MPAFRLHKWYLDCVDAHGNAVIFNWARLTYGPVALCYSGMIRSTGTGTVSQTSWKACDPPSVEGDRIVWRNNALAVEMTWKGVEAHTPMERTLLSDPDGDVRWCLLAQGALAEGRVHGEFFCGCGYVEQLEMTLPPWRLPIDELRWGRAHAANDTAVRDVAWIDWRGPHPLSFMFVDHRELQNVAVSDARISGTGGEGDFRVILAPGDTPGSRVLRDGPLVTSALKGAPGISKWAPASILSAHECKRLSRCVMETPDHGTLHGWAIHEVVRFRGASTAAGPAGEGAPA